MKKLIGLHLLGFSLLTSHDALMWNWAYLPSDATASNAIASAMNQAVAMFNTYSDYNYNIPVDYNAGVPTAQASYHGWIDFGGSISYRVAMHKMSHWLGTGTGHQLGGCVRLVVDELPGCARGFSQRNRLL